MNQSWQSQRRKNWQWRVIIWSSLFLIFGKSLGHWAYNALAIDQAYTATTSAAKRVGLVDVLGTKNEIPMTFALIIDVRNDTPSEYTIETKMTSGHIDFIGHTLSAGNIKRFTMKPLTQTENKSGTGDIVFLSAPMTGSNNTTCQEIHTLNFDLKDAGQVKRPIIVNLSSIASKLECKDNTAAPF